MKLITGVSGRTGGEVATTLLSKNERIRVLVRSDKDAKKWFERGAEITLGDFFDADSVSLAFDGIESAYIMTPPLAHSDDLMRDRLIIETNIVNACQKHEPKNIVCLSAFGAHLKSGTGQIAGLHEMENRFSAAGINFTSLRAAYFMENWDPSISKALEQGTLGSFFQETDLQIEQVSTLDIARCAIESLSQPVSGQRYISVAGPTMCSATDVAAAMSKTLSREIDTVGIPEENWRNIWRSLGWTENRCDLYQEFFNSISSGLAKFNEADEVWRGSISIETYVNSKVG